MADLDPADALELLEAIVIPTLALDQAGRIRWCNAAAERLLAWPCELMRGQPLEALLPQRFRSQTGTPLYAYLVDHTRRGSERSFRMSYLRRDNVEIEVECSVSLLPHGRTVALSLQRRPESFGLDTLPASIESEQRYRLVFEYAPLGIWHFDERGVVTACNDQFVRVIGSSKRAVIGLNQLTLQDSFVVDSVRGALAGKRMRYEGDYRSATGSKVTPVRADFAPIRAEDGAIIGGVGILEDITERKHAEEALRESNAILRAVFAASPAPIVSLGIEGQVRMWNPAAEHVFGYREEEVLGRPLPNVPAERVVEWRSRFEHILKGESLINVETYYLHKDGHVVDVSLSSAALSKSEGEVLGTISVLADITERKRAQSERAALLGQEQAARRAAEEAQLRLEILAEASAWIASSLDYDDTIERAARMALPHFAQRAGVLLTVDDGPLRLVASNPAPLPDAAAVQKLAPEVVRAGRVQVAELHMCVPLVVLGRTLGALWLERDQSEPPFSAADVRLAEEIGRRAGVAIDNARLFRKTEQALRSRDEFLSIASHELRTPVTSLRLAVQNLEAMALEGSLAQAPAAMVLRGLQTAVRQSQHLARLIEELLDISRIQAGRFDLRLDQEVELGALVRATVTRLERELALAGCALVIDAPATVSGRWDAARLDQVITNLLTNAMKFGAGNPIEVALQEGAGEVTVRVRDHGIGIAGEAQARIFERFERGVSAQHYGGLGLGLYIARQIVEAHHGHISVQSVLGQGALFVVSLPR